MKNIWIIYRKELKSYFSSWIAWILMSFFAFVFGYFFFSATQFFVRQSTQAAMMGQGGPMNMNEWIIRPLLMNMSVIGLFLIPMITMRLFAEEKRSGTIELLLTSPVRDAELIVGKWLSALTMYGALLAVSSLNLAYLFIYGKPDWKPLLVGYLGLLMQGGCLLAIGTFISSLTRNQIIAAAVTFAVCLMLWVLDWVTGFESATWARVLSYMSVVTHFEPFSKGVLELKAGIYYLTVIFLGLFLTARSMEALRWRA